MAENKKSFILYADLLNVVGKLPREKAGDLFVHILEYVNDMNPKTDDLLLEIAFEPIKAQLKRDLKEWELQRQQRSDAGKKGMENRWNKDNIVKRVITNDNTVINDITNITDTVTVTVTDNVTDTVIKEKEEKSVFNFRNEFLKLGVEEQILSDWLIVRRKKKASNTKTAFDLIKTKIDKSGLTPNECIKHSAANSWIGFDVSWLKTSVASAVQSKPILDKNKYNPDDVVIGEQVSVKW